ncbi:hypothetical protein MMC17_003563 [Xylographa soralifera]|nr:hypothetical protein [Xylographa soralifera]
MDHAITQTLKNLLPSQNGDLPAELVELALALFAQSKSQAGSLKAEEEIARSYACAHLACSRLKRPLDLSKIDPHPPCPPRVYQSLYRHFDVSLRAGTRRRGRPPKVREEDNQHNVASPPAAKHYEARVSAQEHSTSESLAQEAQRLPRRSQLRTRKDDISAKTKVPDWVMPAIHKLCRSTGMVAAPPHVFVGMATAIELFSTLPANSELKDKLSPRPESLLALLVAVYLYVTFRSFGGQVTALRLDTEARNALEILGRPEKELGNKLPAELQDVHRWIVAFQDNGFLEMDWIQNVPKAIPTEHNLEPALASTDECLGIQNLRGEADESEGGSTLLPGLGTMMQDKVNLVTQAKRSEYDAWKSQMISRISEMEAEEAARLDSTEGVVT